MKWILMLFGILLTSIGLSFILFYTNLMTMGYSFFEFVQFISKRVECLLFLIGWILIVVSIERSRKNVFLLRYRSKFWK